MTLYEMKEAARQLYEMLTDGDIPEEAVNDTLEAMGVEGKIEDYCCVINELNGDILKIDTETKRLAERKSAIQRGIDRMKAGLSDYMTTTGKKKITAGLFNLSFRKSEAVVITNETALPAEFIKTKTTTAPDKTAIKNAIKSGREVSGAEIQTNMNLQIK
jgi:hypothetical protein